MKLAEFSLEGAIIQISNKLADPLGYSTKELIGQHHSLLLTPEYKKTEAYRMFWIKIRNGEAQNGDFEFLAADNSILPVKGSYEIEIDKSKDLMEGFKIILYDARYRENILKATQYSMQEAISEAVSVLAVQDND